MWIPIKEPGDHPAARDNYLITVEVGKVHPARFVTIDHYNGNHEWTNYNKKNQNKYGCKVVAWQPIPEAYRED